VYKRGVKEGRLPGMGGKCSNAKYAARVHFGHSVRGVKAVKKKTYFMNFLRP